MLIAAGWLPDDLGARLFRLAMEVDAAKREHGIAQAEFDRMERVACGMEKEAMSVTDQTLVADALSAWGQTLGFGGKPPFSRVTG